MAEQRASDAERERAAEHLRRAGGDGRLTVDELDERVQQAYEARTRGELERLLDDVAEDAPLARRAAPGSGVSVRPGPGGSRWVVSIMGGAKRAGHWRVAPSCTVLNVMGGSDVDFSQAEFAADRVDVTVFSFWGGADVYVPEDIRVEVTDVGIMGGNDVERGDPADAPPGGPVLHLKLISIMGGANVRRGSREAWRERRRLRRERRRAEEHRHHRLH